MNKFIDIVKKILMIKELKNRILFTLGLLLVYRLGAQIVLPGIDSLELTAFSSKFGGGGLLGILNAFTGGAFGNASIFALGIMPYISASIIIQLLGAVVPYFQKLQKEGEEGRKKITQLTRYGTVLLATMQAIGVSVFLASYPATAVGPVVPNVSLLFYFVTIVTLVTGTIFVMWLGEQISDHGIGNGISLIIMVGILLTQTHYENSTCYKCYNSYKIK
jgi:preprotein translocase subunit SecY